MQNPENSTPKSTGRGPLIAAFVGCLGTALLGLLILIVVGGLAYLNGYSLPPIFSSSTPAATDTPLATLTSVSTSTWTASPTSTTTQTPTASSTSTATIIFPTPTLIPTRTRTPVPQPTRTRTPSPTPTSSVTVMNDLQYDFLFNSWIGLDSSQTLGSGMRCSVRKNEQLMFDISDDALLLKLYFYKGPNQGRARIIIDGAAVETLDLYKAAPQYRFEWTYQFPKPKQAHTVKVLVLREKRNASTGYQVCFDGYRVNNTFVDDIQYNIRYALWNGVWNGKALGGGYRQSASADSTVTFTIRGRSFEWITARGPNYGQAEIYVDDAYYTTVDLFFPTQKWQQSISVSNLGPGNHTIKIVVLGQHHPSSGGDAVIFDGVIVP
ncbi:MAG: hypothetical protein ACOYZ6_00130 [Chloroflexota bacterium]